MLQKNTVKSTEKSTVITSDLKHLQNQIKYLLDVTVVLTMFKKVPASSEFICKTCIASDPSGEPATTSGIVKSNSLELTTVELGLEVRASASTSTNELRSRAFLNIKKNISNTWTQNHTIGKDKASNKKLRTQLLSEREIGI